MYTRINISLDMLISFQGKGLMTTYWINSCRLNGESDI